MSRSCSFELRLFDTANEMYFTKLNLEILIVFTSSRCSQNNHAKGSALDETLSNSRVIGVRPHFIRPMSQFQRHFFPLCTRFRGTHPRTRAFAQMSRIREMYFLFDVTQHGEVSTGHREGKSRRQFCPRNSRPCQRPLSKALYRWR